MTERLRKLVRCQRFSQINLHLLLTQLLHQLSLVLHQQDLPTVHNTDAVSNLLGFFNVMGGQNNRHTACLQVLHHRPHIFAQLHIDAGGRLIKKQNTRLMGQCFCNQHTALHAA